MCQVGFKPLGQHITAALLRGMLSHLYQLGLNNSQCPLPLPLLDVNMQMFYASHGIQPVSSIDRLA